MKKLLALILALAFSLAVSAALADAPSPVLGGWEPYIGDEEGLLPQDALDALDKALEGFVGSDVLPVALLGTQVVAGMNYCILCRVTPVVPNAVPHWSLVYVYADLEGGAATLDFVDIELGAPSLGE